MLPASTRPIVTSMPKFKDPVSLSVSVSLCVSRNPRDQIIIKAGKASVQNQVDSRFFRVNAT